MAAASEIVAGKEDGSATGAVPYCTLVAWEMEDLPLSRPSRTFEQQAGRMGDAEEAGERRRREEEDKVGEKQKTGRRKLP
jgi:hypothetical protein